MARVFDEWGCRLNFDVVNARRAEPALDDPPAGDPFDDCGAPLVVTALAHAACDLRVAEHSSTALVAAESLALREPPDRLLADAVDLAGGVDACEMIAASPRSLTIRTISTSLSLFHVDLQARPPGAR